MKYSITVACLMALVASSRADAGYGLGVPVYAPGHASLDYYSYPKYAFEYAVKDPHTGDNKAQWEKRDGDVVKGAYSLVEPDGSVRIVEYWADDKSGFNAVVKRVGPNLHPVHVPAAPIYKAPIPVLSHEHGYGHGPISIGSVAQYSGLAHAPLLTGPVHGGAYSSASLIKSEPVILKAPAPIISKPIIPVIKEAQILSEPYYNDLVYKAGPIIETPVYKNDLAYKAGPIIETPVYKNDLAYKAGPILETSIYKNDLAYKAGPIIETPVYKNQHAYSAPLAYDHGYAAPQPIKYQYQPIIKAPYQDYQSLAHLGQGLLKQNIGYDYGYLEKGPLLSGWGGYDLGLKH